MPISLIQLLLLLLLAALGLVLDRLFRHEFKLRLAVWLLLIAGVLAVLFPNATTALANLVGVGRGADLLSYGAIMLFCFASVFFLRKLRRLEERQVELVRELALLRQAMNAKQQA